MDDLTMRRAAETALKNVPNIAWFIDTHWGNDEMDSYVFATKSGRLYKLWVTRPYIEELELSDEVIEVWVIDPSEPSFVVIEPNPAVVGPTTGFLTRRARMDAIEELEEVITEGEGGEEYDFNSELDLYPFLQSLA